MHKILLPLFFFALFSTTATAQTLVLWDGGADGTGTAWDDPLNWAGDVLPAATDTVVFPIDVTVGGTANTSPLMLRVNNGAQVVFDLDLSLGDGVTESNAIEVQADSRLVIENSRTFALLPGGEGNGVQIGSAAPNASVNVKGSATLTITGGKHAINIAAADADFTHRGTLTIANPTGSGFRLTAGSVTNKGDISIIGAGQNGIDNAASFINEKTTLSIDGSGTHGIRNKDGGSFLNQQDVVISNTTGTTTDGINNEGVWINEAGSSVTITGMNDDGIDLASGSMDNDGTINITNLAGATGGNAGLSVGSATPAIFTNTSSNSLNIDAGTGTDSRGILVEATGTVNNTGAITLSGGDENQRINNSGALTNDNGGVIDFTDGRMNNSGTLINDGFVTTTRTGSGIFNTGTATNNAFFGYGGGAFATGTGTLVDEGININQGSSFRIDAEMMCEVKIANTSYTYTYGGTPVGTSDASGNFSFDPGSLDQNTVSLKVDGLPNDITVRIQNACSAALPVTLTRLEAVTMAKSVMVKWETATETDNDYIAVERSANGSDFSEIGRVTGSGSRSVSSRYELEDIRPVSGTNYYRLRQVDLDGTATYSHVVNADFAGAAAGVMRVFPTLLSPGAPLNVDLGQSVAKSVSITDSNGRRVSTRGVTTGAIIVLPTRDLPPGVYYLTANGPVGAESQCFLIK